MNNTLHLFVEPLATLVVLFIALAELLNAPTASATKTSNGDRALTRQSPTRPSSITTGQERQAAWGMRSDMEPSYRETRHGSIRSAIFISLHTAHRSVANYSVPVHLAIIEMHKQDLLLNRL